MQRFEAHTQYDDLLGTVAADRSDSLDFTDLLKERNLIRDDEHLVGFEIVFNENSGNPIASPGIVAFLGLGQGVDDVAQRKHADGHFNLRAVEVFDLPLADFFRYFKRFNVYFANASLGLSGSDWQGRE